MRGGILTHIPWWKYLIAEPLLFALEFVTVLVTALDWSCGDESDR
jgi:hypothetical protein